MPQVHVLPHPELCPNGQTFEAREGSSLCLGLLKAGVSIEHACDMVSACATCHVHVRSGTPLHPEPDDAENDQLDNAWGLDAQSRLACCVRLGAGDLTIELPRHTRNYAREG